MCCHWCTGVPPAAFIKHVSKWWCPAGVCDIMRYIWNPSSIHSKSISTLALCFLGRGGFVLIIIIILICVPLKRLFLLITLPCDVLPLKSWAIWELRVEYAAGYHWKFKKGFLNGKLHFTSAWLKSKHRFAQINFSFSSTAAGKGVKCASVWQEQLFGLHKSKTDIY